MPLIKRQELLQRSHKFICRCFYCVNDVNFDQILSCGSNALIMAIEKTRRFDSHMPLASYKDLSVELLNQLKENNQLIIENATNLCSAEYFILPGYNHGLFHILGAFMNFPCILNDDMFINAPKFSFPF